MTGNNGDVAADAIPQDKKIVAGVAAILLGSLGIHKFYLGYNMQGLTMLLVSILPLGFLFLIIRFIGIVILPVGFLLLIMWLVGVIEGILYLTKTPGQFKAEYIDGKRPWF